MVDVESYWELWVFLTDTLVGIVGNLTKTYDVSVGVAGKQFEYVWGTYFNFCFSWLSVLPPTLFSGGGLSVVGWSTAYSVGYGVEESFRLPLADGFCDWYFVWVREDWFIEMVTWVVVGVSGGWLGNL